MLLNLSLDLGGGSAPKFVTRVKRGGGVLRNLSRQNPGFYTPYTLLVKTPLINPSDTQFKEKFEYIALRFYFHSVKGKHGVFHFILIYVRANDLHSINRFREV